MGMFVLQSIPNSPNTKLKNSRLVDLLLPGWNQLIGLSHQRLEEIFPNILVEIPEVHQRKIPTCSQITLQIQGRWIFFSTPVATAWRMQQRLPYTLAPPHKKKEITASDTLWPFSSNLCESKKLFCRLPSDTVQLAHLLRTTSDHHGRLAEGSTRVHSMVTPLVETKATWASPRALHLRIASCPFNQSSYLTPGMSYGRLLFGTADSSSAIDSSLQVSNVPAILFFSLQPTWNEGVKIHFISSRESNNQNPPLRSYGIKVWPVFILCRLLCHLLNPLAGLFLWRQCKPQRFTGTAANTPIDQTYPRIRPKNSWRW